MATWVIIGVVFLLLAGQVRANDGGVFDMGHNSNGGALPSSFSERIWQVCRAVACAEGYGVDGAKPTRLNNPGDLVDSSGSIASYPTPDSGWQALYHQIELMATGRSHVYSPDMTWMEIASKYTETEQVEWATNVTNYLGVPLTSTLADYVGA